MRAPSVIKRTLSFWLFFLRRHFIMPSMIYTIRRSRVDRAGLLVGGIVREGHLSLNLRKCARSKLLGRALLSSRGIVPIAWHDDSK